jgi:hypothetical protein
VAGRDVKRRRARARRRREHYRVVVPVDPEPVVLPEGDVVDEPLPVVPVAEPEPLVEPLPGVVVVPGDAAGGVVRSGVLPTRSDSVWLQAAVTPASNARAQTPESILFISRCSSLWGVRPGRKPATAVPARAA